jgi:hypothetical protein
MPTYSPVTGQTAGSGGGGVGVTPGWEFIERFTVAGAAITSFDFSSVLNGDVDGIYKILGVVYPTGGSPRTYLLRANGASSGAGYFSETIDFALASISTGTSRLVGQFGSEVPSVVRSNFEATIWSDRIAGSRSPSYTGQTYGSLISSGTWRSIGTLGSVNITSLGFESTAALSIDVDSYFNLYKLRQV